jgi:ATP-dependent DNA helicase RecQ
VSAAGWRDLIEQLLFEGLLREDPNDGRPLIGLGDTAEVRAVYRGERRVSVRHMPAAAEAGGRGERERKRRGERLPVEPADAALFEALRAWRRERAAEQGVPPYVIFHDTTLIAIAGARPADEAALTRISGVGVMKLARYAADVLRVVREA